MTEKVKEIQLNWLRELNISRGAIAKKIKCSDRAIYNYFRPKHKADGLTERAIHESINHIITTHEGFKNRPVKCKTCGKS